MPTCYCKQKLATLAPPPSSSDWSTVLELTLMSGAACKSWNSFNLTRRLNGAWPLQSCVFCSVSRMTWRSKNAKLKLKSVQLLKNVSRDLAFFPHSTARVVCEWALRPLGHGSWGCLVHFHRERIFAFHCAVFFMQTCAFASFRASRLWCAIINTWRSS